MSGRPQFYISETLPGLIAAAAGRPAVGEPGQEGYQPAIPGEDWMPEFQSWVQDTFGPRPTVYERAMRDWDSAVAGALLAFSFLVDQMGGLDGPDQVPGAHQPGVGSPDGDGEPGTVPPPQAGGVQRGDAVPGDDVQQDLGGGQEDRPLIVRPGGDTFAVLGPDGSAVVEGFKE